MKLIRIILYCLVFLAGYYLGKAAMITQLSRSSELNKIDQVALEIYGHMDQVR